MGPYYLAVDIGASSGKMVLGWREGEALRTQEVHRFPNGASLKNGRLCWDMEGIFREIVAGLRRCGELGKPPASMGIDTWGVDFLLLGKDGLPLDEAVSYRDKRTEGMDALLDDIIPQRELYARTGIQKQIFNTIYQLLAVKRETPWLLQQAERFLTVPDYLHYRLTGRAENEYTIATTTQLIHAKTRTWDWELLERLGLPARLFRDPLPPGTALGPLLPRLAEEVGFSCQVVLPASHDTASAVLAVPAREKNFLFLSSGTWSLLGMVRQEPDCSEASRLANVTNEGGFGGTIRYLKNIMGLWMLQSLKKELGEEYTFPRLSREAEAAGRFPAALDVDDRSFLAPESMAGAVRSYCRRTGQPVPETPGELASCIYHGLAARYAQVVQELEALTNIRCPRLYLVGGGCRDGYLNRLTAQSTGKEVLAGPAEATAIGNLLAISGPPRPAEYA